MQQTETRPGVYIDRDSCKILRVAEGNELDGREGNWEVLTDDPDTGLLAARETAIARGYTQTPTDVDWYRFEEATADEHDIEVIEEANKEAAKAEAKAQAEFERDHTVVAQ
jgi:hypothetical protein